MIFSEQWTKWSPILGFSGHSEIELISENEDNFLIVANGEKNQKVRIVFDIGVDAYRVTGEVYCNQLVDNLKNKYGKTFLDWSFFKVTNSEYLKWLAEQSCGFLDPSHFIHFVFFADNCLVDIATTYEPHVELID